MATIKSFTDLEQSKVLSKILPIESADMYYMETSRNNYTIGVLQRMERDMLLKQAEYYKISPCWSLAALLGVIKSVADYTMQSLNCKESFIVCELGSKPWNITAEYDSEIDACVEMILKLKENELI